jgi:hypothetical protein
MTTPSQRMSKTIWREIRRTDLNPRKKISKRKEKTLPKSCVSAPPSPRAILGKKNFLKNHTFLLPVRLKLELSFYQQRKYKEFLSLKLNKRRNCEKGLFKVQTWLKINNPKLCFTTSRLTSSTSGACFTTWWACKVHLEARWMDGCLQSNSTSY